MNHKQVHEISRFLIYYVSSVPWLLLIVELFIEFRSTCPPLDSHPVNAYQPSVSNKRKPIVCIYVSIDTIDQFRTMDRVTVWKM